MEITDCRVPLQNRQKRGYRIKPITLMPSAQFWAATDWLPETVWEIISTNKNSAPKKVKVNRLISRTAFVYGILFSLLKASLCLIFFKMLFILKSSYSLSDTNSIMSFGVHFSAWQILPTVSTVIFLFLVILEMTQLLMPAAFSRSFFFISLSISNFQSFLQLISVPSASIQIRFTLKMGTAGLACCEYNNIFSEKTQGFTKRQI